MDAKVLEVAGKLAGLAGLSVAAILLLFRDIVRRNIFPRLSAQDAYRLIRLLAILAFIVAMSGITTWGYLQGHQAIQSKGTDSSETEVARQRLLGVARRAVDESSNEPIQQAALTISGRPESYVSEDNGNFRITIQPGMITDRSVRIRVGKEGYVAWDRSVGVPVENLVIQMRRSTK